MMKKRIIELSKRAYKQSLKLGIETYQYEAGGLVLGKIHKKIIYEILEISPIQEAIRKFSELNYQNYREERIENIEKIFGLQLLGDIHSHTDYQNSKLFRTLSDFDKPWLKENPNLISLILFIESTQRLFRWNITNKRIVSSYRLKDKNLNLKTMMKGYYYEPETKKYLLTEMKPKKNLENFIKRINRHFN